MGGITLFSTIYTTIIRIEIPYISLYIFHRFDHATVFGQVSRNTHNGRNYIWTKKAFTHSLYNHYIFYDVRRFDQSYNIYVCIQCLHYVGCKFTWVAMYIPSTCLTSRSTLYLNKYIWQRLLINIVDVALASDDCQCEFKGENTNLSSLSF